MVDAVATMIDAAPHTRTTAPTPRALEVVTVTPPPPSQRVRRDAAFAAAGEKRTRYSLPSTLQSASPVGYRTRLSLTRDEAAQALALLSLGRPSGFAPTGSVTEQELFEEASLGILSSRQSTNFRGHRQVTLGPEDSRALAKHLRALDRAEGQVFDHALYSHIVLTRPYRTPFTFMLTFVGHKPLRSLVTVAQRAWKKRYEHVDDIPTIGYLQQLHLGILADAMERATILASSGRRRAQVFLEPMPDDPKHRDAVRAIEALAGLSDGDRARGWRVGLVAQVGEALPAERVALPTALCRKLGANLLSFRSERVQPGVNAEDVAPERYKMRQDMDVPEAFTTMAGRAAYNAFSHWTSCPRDRGKDLLLLDRVDVLTPDGKQRLRAIRDELAAITDATSRDMPQWADIPTGRALSGALQRGKKAFALAGQRIYIGGLSRREVEAAGLGFTHAVRAFGAAASRSALYAELMGCVDLPADCDLLAGVCLMAGPVNQNDVGKCFYGYADLLAGRHPDRDPTSLLVWTVKAKTIADPIGNEEQLLNAKQKGALVDLRMGPHEAVSLRQGTRLVAMRREAAAVNEERAFGDQGNFVTAPDGADIPGNRGTSWPEALARAVVFAHGGA